MNIAFLAHDKKKEEIIELAKKYKDVLAEYELYATGTTGTLIMGETALPIHRMKSGPLGGDQQIGSMVAEGKLDLIVFLRDPLFCDTVADAMFFQAVFPTACEGILSKKTKLVNAYL